MISKLFDFLSGGIVKSVDGVIKTIWGDRAARERRVASQNQSVIDQFAAEFRNVNNRTWWDSFIDGVNRLPRPAMAFSVLALFGFCMYQPEQFAVRMKALGLVPEWLAVVLTTIVGFYFTFRHLEKRLQFKGPSAEQVEGVANAMDKIDKVERRRISDAEYEKQMADEDTPLSNQAIKEWNKRNN